MSEPKKWGFILSQFLPKILPPGAMADEGADGVWRIGRFVLSESAVARVPGLDEILAESAVSVIERYAAGGNVHFWATSPQFLGIAPGTDPIPLYRLTLDSTSGDCRAVFDRVEGKEVAA